MEKEEKNVDEVYMNEIWDFLDNLHAAGHGFSIEEMEKAVPYIVCIYRYTYDKALHEVKFWVKYRKDQFEQTKQVFLVE